MLASVATSGLSLPQAQQPIPEPVLSPPGSSELAAPQDHASTSKLLPPLPERAAILNDVCSAGYPKLWRALKTEHERVLVFGCPVDGLCGGLGDRLAGLISVGALAAVTGRSVIIDDDDLLMAFDLATPAPRLRPDTRLLRNGTLLQLAPDGSERQRVEPAVAKCHNLRSCFAIEDFRSNNSRLFSADVVRVEANRAWLCRWSRGPWIAGSWLGSGLNQLLSDGHTDDVDLFHAGGCLLRAMLRPKEDVLMRAEALLKDAGSWTGVHHRTFQIGMASRAMSLAALDTASVTEQAYEDAWTAMAATQGTGSHALEGTASCVSEAMGIAQSWGSQHGAAAFASMGVLVLSDDERAAHGIGALVSNRSTAARGPVLAAPLGQACHIDKNGKNGTHATFEARDACATSAAVEWVALSFADVQVSRAMDLGGVGAYTWHVLGDYPLSSYSRYAALYGLLPGIYLSRPGQQPSCLFKSSKALGTMSQGNWVCATDSNR